MKKALIGMALVGGVAGYLALRSGSSEEVVSDDSLIVNRIWIDHIPRDDRDTIQVFVAITEQPFGIFQAASQWKGNYELFRYERNGGELRVVYGQSGERETIKAKATACGERDWDFCLELKGGRGAKRYYSMKGWEIEGTHIDEHDIVDRVVGSTVVP